MRDGPWIRLYMYRDYPLCTCESGFDNSDRNEALHHCTLLVNANIEILNKVLKSKDPRIETSATRSLRVDVKCLSDIGITDPTHMDNVRDLETACNRNIQGHTGGLCVPRNHTLV